MVVLAACLGLAALALGAARLKFALTEPLWFDEAFILAIVAPPDGASFWREVYLDPNGPAYYLFERAWTGLFGFSNLALRTPSLLALWISAALPLAIPVRGLTREAQITWAALIFAWWGVGYFLDARCYAILLAVSTLQTLAFGRLIDRPGLRLAFIWAATAAAAILLHYYALFLGLAQGLIYLWRHRWTAVRTWPATLAFLPAFAWIAHHAPRLVEYSELGSVWHPPVTAQGVFDLTAFSLAPSNATVSATVAIILIVGLLAARNSSMPPGDDEGALSDHLILTATAGLLALALTVGFGLLGSGLSPRYLLPVAPSLLLGVVLVAGASPRPRVAWTALVILYFAIQIRPIADALSSPHALPRYEFETGANFLMAHDVTDVVFVWDHEVSPIIATSTLTRLGGVFFARADRLVRVRPLRVYRQQDPNLQIAAEVKGPRSGFIWLYNRKGKTAANRFPPILGKGDARWDCAQLGDGDAGALACRLR